MSGPGGGLPLVGKYERRTHLARQHAGNIATPLLVLVEDRAQQIEPLLARGVGESRQRRAAGPNGSRDVRRTAAENLGEGFLGRWIDDIDRLRLQGIEPPAIDVMLTSMLHPAQPGSLNPVPAGVRKT